jgi:hypothetical protein
MSPIPRSRRRAVVFAFACFCLFGLSTLGAQTTPNADALALPEEEPKAENPFRRLEIVSLGSYPISLFYIGFIYDIKRYYENNRESAYLPWPFNATSSVSLDNAERVSRLEAALCLSFTVGVIDAIIHASKVKKAKRLREAQKWATSPEEGP